MLARRNEDSIERLMEWPWLGFAAALMSGALVGVIVVIVRRRTATKRGG
jgi:hypothetical protein